MAYFTGEVLAAGKDTVFVGASYPITELIEIALYGIIHCNDPSGIANPWLLFDLYPGLKLSLTAYVPIGGSSSVLGMSGPSGFARLRFSF